MDAAHLDIHVANLEVPFRVNITVGGLDLFNPHAAAKEGMLHNWFVGRDPPATTPGLHKLWYPSIRDTSTWNKFGAHGERTWRCFPVLQLRCALIL